MANMMTTMQLELPLFVLASQLNISYAQNVTTNNQNCTNFYANLGFPPNQTNSLCGDTSNTFNWVKGPGFEGYFKSSVALLSSYFYQ
jgi:hypothetical protein